MLNYDYAHDTQTRDTSTELPHKTTTYKGQDSARSYKELGQEAGSELSNKHTVPANE